MPPQKRSQPPGKTTEGGTEASNTNKPPLSRLSCNGSWLSRYLLFTAQLCFSRYGKKKQLHFFCVTYWKLLYNGNYRNDNGTGFRALPLRPNIFHGAKPRRYKTFVDKVCLPKLKNTGIKYHEKTKTKIWERKSWNAKSAFRWLRSVPMRAKKVDYSLTVLVLDFNYYLEKTRSAIKPYFSFPD